jgi:DNA repair and recombination protein RAD54B
MTAAKSGVSRQIVFYIQYLRNRKQLASCVPSIDLIICDEGQRLKSRDNKTTKMFDELRTVRRIRKSLLKKSR